MNEFDKKNLELSDITTKVLNLRNEFNTINEMIKNRNEDLAVVKTKLDTTNDNLTKLYNEIDKKHNLAMDKVRDEETRINEIQRTRNIDLNNRESAITQAGIDIKKMKADITQAKDNIKLLESKTKQGELLYANKNKVLDEKIAEYTTKSLECDQEIDGAKISKDVNDIKEKNLDDRELELIAREQRVEKIETKIDTRELEMNTQEQKIAKDIANSNKLLQEIALFNRDYITNKKDLEEREHKQGQIDKDNKERSKQLTILEMKIKQKERDRI